MYMYDANFIYLKTTTTAAEEFASSCSISLAFVFRSSALDLPPNTCVANCDMDRKHFEHLFR